VLLPGNDAVTNEEQRRQKGKEHPRGIEEERQPGNDQDLADVVGIPAESIRARHHQLTACTVRGDRCSGSPKLADYRATEGQSPDEENTARDAEAECVKDERPRPQGLE
jgi:hypothetical protein